MATPVPATRASRFPPLSTPRMIVLCGLMHAASHACCIGATPAFAAATAVPAASVAMPAAAEGRATVRQDGKTDERTDAPSTGATIDAFLRARRWLDADALPATSDQAAQIDLPGTTAVCVILRHNGRVVGFGDDDAGDGLMLRRAVGRAVLKALGDETIRSVRGAAGDRVTVQLALEVELAGPLRPLLGRTISEAAARVVPGRDGLAVRRADAMFRAYPSRLLAADIADRPDRSITALLIDAGLPAKDLNEYATADRVSLARFATRRMREATPGALPDEVGRAGRTVPVSEVTPSSVRVLAIQLAARLAAQVVASDPADAARGVRLLGTLNPTADTYDPPFANREQSALAALALASAARSDALPAPIRERAALQAKALAASDALLWEEPARLDAAAASGDFATPMFALAAIRAGADEAMLRRLDSRLNDILARARKPEAAPETAARGSESARFLALAAALEHGDETLLRTALSELPGTLDALDDRPAAVLQAGLPLACLSRAPALPQELRARIRTLLAGIELQLAPSQVGHDPELGAGMPEDLIGGLVPPTAPRFRIDPNSLLHSAALICALPSDAPETPAGHGAFAKRALRLVMQLTAADPWVDGFQRPAEVRGLVRGSLESDDCPPEATALALLAALGSV